MDTRLHDLERFYSLLGELECRIGGKRLIAECSGWMKWPQRGVYFFFEDGEERTGSGSGPRVVRVGTHGLKAGSGTSLWNRLSQHRGSVRSGGGNHRGSIFRLLVGSALISRDNLSVRSWDNGQSTASKEIRQSEQSTEEAVSAVIGAMSVLWVGIDDEAMPDSERGVIERGAIALLSNWKKEPIDIPSSVWLGRESNRERVRGSGLWNNNHVDESYTLRFLDVFERYIQRMGGRT